MQAGAHYPIHEKTMEDCEQKRRQTTCMQALTRSLMSFLESTSRSRERMVASHTSKMSNHPDIGELLSDDAVV